MEETENEEQGDDFEWSKDAVLLKSRQYCDKKCWKTPLQRMKYSHRKCDGTHFPCWEDGGSRETDGSGLENSNEGRIVTIKKFDKLKKVITMIENLPYKQCTVVKEKKASTLYPGASELNKMFGFPETEFFEVPRLHQLPLSKDLSDKLQTDTE